MKKITAFLLCFVLLFSVTGCGGDKGPKEITLLTLNNYMPSDTLEEFTEETGITISHVTASSYEEIQSMVEKDPSAYDVVIACDYVLDALVKGNLLQEIDYKNFDNYKYVIPGYTGQYYDPENKFTVPYAAVGILIGYDPALAGIIVDSYGDLLAPEFAGSVVFPDEYDAIVGIANLTINKEPGNTEDLSDVVKIIRALSNCRFQPTGESLYPEDALINGDASMGILYTTQLGYAISANPNLEIVYPKEGFLASIDCIAITAAADAKASAMEFINYVHDPVVNGKLAQEISYSSTNISGKQFMDKEYQNDGYNIKNDNASDCILVPKFDEDTKRTLLWCYRTHFLTQQTQTVQ